MHRVSLRFTFSASSFGGSSRTGGTVMDSAAFQDIIALARGTAAELAATEKKVSAFKDELAQDHDSHQAQLNASLAMYRPMTINPRRSGWIPVAKPNRTGAASVKRTALKDKT
jgi:hypothetical protein